VKVRLPAVAGAFYPADADALRASVDELLASATPPPVARRPDALVVPHAGYVYSGPVAATAYAALAPWRNEISRVVLLGPAHRIALRGLALPSVDAFRTPLGDVMIDDAGRASLVDVPGVVIDDLPHALEHSVEVHLPFLQRLLDAFTIVPFVVGSTDAPSVANVLDGFWDAKDSLVVVSTDLSHYEQYDSAASHDRRTVAAIVANDIDAVHPDDACGVYPLRGLLALAQRHGVAPQLLDLRSSGDTAGSRDRVVGYGAFAVAGAAA
jgi:MEMO1 family protein